MERKRKVKLLVKESTQKKEHLTIKNLSTTKNNIKDKEDKMENKKEQNKPTTIDFDHVGLILEEANKWGVKWEVEQTAKVYMVRDHLPMVESYQHALKDWVK